MERENFLDNVEEKDERLEALKQLYPEIFSDGKINLDAFKDATGTSDLPEGEDKTPGYYGLYWPGKRAAKQLAKKPATGTLEPVPGDGVNEDSTHNIYIEGDNLEVLRALRNSYRGRVKMIYIDPPYNTGNDFIYPDDFAEPVQEYLKITGQIDEKGKKLVANPKSSGAFHRNWLNMMYPRLSLARELLSEDGVIFISIDDNEQANLKLLCDDVFGEENFIADIVWKRKRGRDNSARWFSKAHEYLCLYAKDKECFDVNYLELDEETKKAYKNPDNDPRGPYRMLGCWARGTQGVEYDFTDKHGQYFETREWLFSKENLEKLDKDDKLIIRGDNVYRKMFIYENKGKIPETLWDDVSNAANASDEIKNLFGSIVFDTPKPIPYIKEMLKIATNKDSLIMDFFSGSATTAHAVMELNSEDNGNRKYIMVQLPFEIDASSEAAKAGYKYITEIAKERIRRAGKAVEDISKTKTDIGFKVYRLSESSFTKFKPVKGQGKEVLNEVLEAFGAAVDPLVDGWKVENVLEEIKLRQGFALDCQVEEMKEISSNKVWHLVDKVRPISLYVCLDEKIDDKTVDSLNIGKDDKFICLNSAISDTTYARLADKERVQTL